MTVTRLLVLCLGLCSYGPALSRQAPDNSVPPGVTILRYKWEDATPGISADPTNRASEQLRGGGSGPVSPPAHELSSTQPKKPYVYSMQVRNSGPRVIEAVAWDYVFDDPINKTEMRRHSFGSFEKIGINGVKTLRVRSVSSPSLVVDAAAAKNKQAPFDEHVVIKCVLFTDGTVWKSPVAPVCQDLREELIRRKKPKP